MFIITTVSFHLLLLFCFQHLEFFYFILFSVDIEWSTFTSVDTTKTSILRQNVLFFKEIIMKLIIISKYNSIIIKYANKYSTLWSQTAWITKIKIMMLKTFFYASIQIEKFINFYFQFQKNCIERKWPVVNVCYQNKWLFMVSCTMLTQSLCYLFSFYSIVLLYSILRCCFC